MSMSLPLFLPVPVPPVRDHVCLHVHVFHFLLFALMYATTENPHERPYGDTICFIMPIRPNKADSIVVKMLKLFYAPLVLMSLSISKIIFADWIIFNAYFFSLVSTPF
jgi:hypothetical protein